VRTTQTSRRGEAGFTLIEMMVVLLVVGILIAITIPMFLGARTRAQDRSAESSLRNALTAAKAEYVQTGSYAAVDDPALNAAEPSISFIPQSDESTGPKVVSVHPVSSTVWVAVALSDSGTCFGIKDDLSDRTTYAMITSGHCMAAGAVGSATWLEDW
jgi:type IV pilus assembly protein PilA